MVYHQLHTAECLCLRFIHGVLRWLFSGPWADTRGAGDGTPRHAARSRAVCLCGAQLMVDGCVRLLFDAAAFSHHHFQPRWLAVLLLQQHQQRSAAGYKPAAGLQTSAFSCQLLAAATGGAAHCMLWPVN